MSQQRRTYNQRQALSRYEERRRQEEARREMLQRRREKEQESRELAKGPIDLPFLPVGAVADGGRPCDAALRQLSLRLLYHEKQRPNLTTLCVRASLPSWGGGHVFHRQDQLPALPGRCKILLYLSIILLVLVIIPGNPLAVTRNNATRWLGIGDLFTFQPSEIAKVAVVIYFSDSISKKKDQMRSFRYGILPYAIWLVVLGGLVGLEPHLSGAILIMGVGAALMLVGGINWAWVIGAVGAAGAAMYLVLFVIGYNTSRITTG